MCIYYPNQPSLTYSSEDHVFSAAIGGKLKLPKGYVSDQINNELSKFEQDLFREGPVGLARILEGPGKRGSLSPGKQIKSRISLLSGGTDGRTYSLGYAWNQKVHEIPQVMVPLDAQPIAFSYDVDSTDGTPAEVIETFRRDCMSWSTLRCRTILSAQIDKNKFLLGMAKGVEENYNCFLAKHPENTFELNEANLRKIADALLGTQDPRGATYTPTVHSEVKFHPDQLRVFGKIAFNVLAYIKGEEYVLSPAFDPLRLWITRGGEFQARWHREISDYFRQGLLKIPEKAHLVMLKPHKKLLMASVILYNSMSVTLVMTDQLPGPMDLDGMVCDWKKNEEFRFLELIARSTETVNEMDEDE